jgi:hypothetical protein
MIDFSEWVGVPNGLPTNIQQVRAAKAWQRILDKPSVVAFRTPAGTTAAVQTVRIEAYNQASSGESNAGATPKRKVVVFGIRNHASLPDTIVKERYRFVLNSEEYTVVSIIRTLGETQAVAEVSG